MVDHSVPLMTLENICKGFENSTDRIEILEHADFMISEGETIAVVGSSGIGKSTLLNIIGTLDHPNAGKLFFKDQDLFSLKDEKLARFRNSQIGFVFQFHYLLQGFTALENVMIPGMIAQKNKKSIEKRAINMLERVGLELRSSHRVEDLSGGEQQRVALARALVMEPKVLLADEPTGNLDQKNSESIHDLLDELNKELGMTVIIVTHNNDLAQMMHRKVTITNGKIIPV